MNVDSKHIETARITLGLCPTCGQQIQSKGSNGRFEALTNETVFRSRCLLCKPMSSSGKGSGSVVSAMLPVQSTGQGSRSAVSVNDSYGYQNREQQERFNPMSTANSTSSPSAVSPANLTQSFRNAPMGRRGSSRQLQPQLAPLLEQSPPIGDDRKHHTSAQDRLDPSAAAAVQPSMNDRNYHNHNNNYVPNHNSSATIASQQPRNDRNYHHPNNNYVSAQERLTSALNHSNQKNDYIPVQEPFDSSATVTSKETTCAVKSNARNNFERQRQAPPPGQIQINEARAQQIASPHNPPNVHSSQNNGSYPISHAGMTQGINIAHSYAGNPGHSIHPNHGLQNIPNHGMQINPNHGLQSIPNHGTHNNPHHGMQSNANHGMQNNPNHGMHNSPNHGTHHNPNHGMQNNLNHGMHNNPSHGTYNNANHGNRKKYKNPNWDDQSHAGRSVAMSVQSSSQALLQTHVASDEFQKGWDYFMGDHFHSADMNTGKELILSAKRRGNIVARGFAYFMGWTDNGKADFVLALQCFREVTPKEGRNRADNSNAGGASTHQNCTMNALAMHGYFLRNGYGTSAPDYNQSMRLLGMASDMGHSWSMAMLANSCLKGGTNNSMAFALYQKSAKLGYAKAMYELSNLYKAGIGCYVDMKKSDSWLKKALQQDATLNEDPEKNGGGSEKEDTDEHSSGNDDVDQQSFGSNKLKSKRRASYKSSSSHDSSDDSKSRGSRRSRKSTSSKKSSRSQKSRQLLKKESRRGSSKLMLSGSSVSDFDASDDSDDYSRGEKSHSSKKSVQSKRSISSRKSTSSRAKKNSSRKSRTEKVDEMFGDMGLKSRSQSQNSKSRSKSVEKKKRGSFSRKFRRGKSTDL